MNEGRVPPYNAEAERAVLGSILLNNDCLSAVMGITKVEDFYVEVNRRIFDAMCGMGKLGAIDAVTLGAELEQRGDLEKIGGAITLSDLTDTVVTAANVEHYARIVGETAAVRRMIYAAQEIAATGFVLPNSASEYLADSRKSITLAASALTIGTGPQRIDEDLKEIYNEVTEGKPIKGLVTTGIENIDRVTGGLHPGLLTVLAGRPSMGKSAFVLNIAMNAALADFKVLYITLEDVRKPQVKRLFARFADIDLQELMLNRLTGDKGAKCAKMIEGMRKLTGHPLWIEDASGLTTSAIQQLAAAHKSIHGLDLLIVDHLGEVADKGESMTAITEAAAKGERDIAKELGIPVLLAVQLNRKVEDRADKRPTLGDLRQSGAIEQVARVVWFLYRPGYYLEGGDDLPQASLIVAKATHGKTGSLRLWSDMSRMYFRSWDDSRDGVFKQLKREAKEEDDSQGSFFNFGEQGDY